MRVNSNFIRSVSSISEKHTKDKKWKCRHNGQNPILSYIEARMSCFVERNILLSDSSTVGTRREHDEGTKAAQLKTRSYGWCGNDPKHDISTVAIEDAVDGQWHQRRTIRTCGDDEASIVVRYRAKYTQKLDKDNLL